MSTKLFTNIELQHVSSFFITETKKNCNKLPVSLSLVSLRNWNRIILVENSNFADRKENQLIAR